MEHSFDNPAPKPRGASRCTAIYAVYGALQEKVFLTLRNIIASIFALSSCSISEKYNFLPESDDYAVATWEGCRK
jgi:hypothetical protein